MASSSGFLLILLGAFLTAVGFEFISSCLGMFSNDPLCWTTTADRFVLGPVGLYSGGACVLLGAIILVGDDVVRLLRKL